MAQIAEAGRRLLAKLLLDAGQPSLGALPGVVRAIELVRAVGPVAGRKQNVGRTRLGLQPTLAGKCVAAVVAVGDEAVRGVAAAGQLLGKWPRGVGCTKMFLQRAVVSRARPCHHAQSRGWRSGQQVHRAADGVRSVERGARTMQYIHARDGVQRHGNVQVQVAGFGIVHAQPVDQNQRLLEGGAADCEVGLHAFAGARLQVERWVGAQQIDHTIGPRQHLARLDHLHRAIALGQRQRFHGRRHLNALGNADRSLRLGESRSCGRACARRTLLADAPSRAEQTEREVRESFIHEDCDALYCVGCGWPPFLYLTSRGPSPRACEEVEWACEHIDRLRPGDSQQGRTRANAFRPRRPCCCGARPATRRCARWHRWCARASTRPTHAPTC